ncbi:MAG: tetratricopeptide repeat protein [Gaiellaceae bacterium]
MRSGPDSELVARLLTNVATARIDDDEVESAGPLLDRALELHERHFGPESRWTAYVLTTQGHHAWLEGRYEDARGAFERAFVIRAEELGPTDPETLDAALDLMNVLTEIAGDPSGGAELEGGSSGAMDEASALYLPLAALRPDLDSPLPSGARPDPAQAAEQLRRLADRIARRIAPDAQHAAAIERAREHTDEADSLYLSGDLAAAGTRLREAIASLEAARGPSDTSLVEPLQRLKLVHRVGGTESEVLPILRRIATILADSYGRLHPLSIRALGEVYRQERREYGPAGGRETAVRIEELLRDAFGEESALWRLLHEVFDGAREAVPPGVEPEDPPLSVRRERILAQPDPLVDELLFDLDATPWPELDHAYGAAIDTPLHLRLLLADDDRVREDAVELVRESLLRPGTVTSALAPAIRLVRRLAEDERVPGRAVLVELLAEAAAVTSSNGADA